MKAEPAAFGTNALGATEAPPFTLELDQTTSCYDFIAFTFAVTVAL